MSELRFIPKTCQWIHDDNSKCKLSVVRTKSYCSEHHAQAYHTASDSYVDAMASKELLSIKDIKACETIEPEE